MPITVAELLADPRLRLEPLVTGDVDRVIRWVHSSEMPDPSAYLRGDEVVLSAGIWLWAGSSPSVFADGLAGAGAAAVGFGPSTLVPTVPDELVAACSRHGLTLFSVPDSTPFIAVIETFVERYAEDRQRALLDARQRNEELVLAAQEGRGVRGVLRVLARHRAGASWVVDRRRGLLAWTGARPAGALVEPVEKALARGGGLLQSPGWTIVPILPTGGDACLVVEGELAALPVEERTAIEQAVAFLAIELQRDLAVRESERRFAAELVDLIAAGDAQLPAATARLEAFGFDPAAALVAIVCEPDDPERGLVAIERLLAARDTACVAAVKGVHVVAFLGGPGSLVELRELARELHVATDAAVGVGGLASGTPQLRRSLLEAQQACHFAHRGPAGYAMNADVGSHAVLLALQDESVLSVFRDALLRPLEAHDARRHTDLVRTLELFLESGAAYQATAAALHIHVNTLRLRLARIEELTGRNLGDMETRVDFFIALRARR
jgi:PucR family transcriptional regulator, purine catabolism regulatory protein